MGLLPVFLQIGVKSGVKQGIRRAENSRNQEKTGKV